MSDRYLELVNTGVTKSVAKRLGLPRPSLLRRSADGAGAPGPVLVVGSRGSGRDVDVVADALAGGGAEVRRQTPRGARIGAIVVVLTELGDVADLADPILAVGAALRDLAPSGRVVTLSRPLSPADGPELAAAREAVEGVLRSLAKELRAGATGNGVLLGPGVGVGAPSVLGAVRFLLAPASAFVSGQSLLVGGTAGADPADPARPLAGQVAVVTGAARGIGAAIARTLARDGARVIGVDVPAAGEALARVANEVQGMAVQLDITADDAAERLIDHALPRFGALDVVVHNAGILRDKLLANMTREKWDGVVAVNLQAQLRINRALVLGEALGPAPRLVSLASTSGIAGNRGQTNYAASKAGVIGMTRALAPELAALGGTANAVAPGFIETDMTARIPPVARELARRASTLRQGGLPVDVAEAVAFLASPQAGGVNGQVLRVCGQNLVGR